MKVTLFCSGQEPDLQDVCMLQWCYSSYICNSQWLLSPIIGVATNTYQKNLVASYS